ncbi:MAG: DUF6680 family protein [Alphaproteobacteria bacterium]
MEWLTLIAIFLGPLAGVFLAEYLAKRKSRNERRHSIFRTLLASKAAHISIRVEALNVLPYEFQGETEVILAWRNYLSATNRSSSDEQEQINIAQSIGNAFDELLFTMVKALKIGIEQRDILQGTYNPVGVTYRQEQDEHMRRSLMNFMAGAHPIKVKIVSEDK